MDSGETRMTDDEAFERARAELTRARKKFPLWPADPFVALAVLQEEVGELTKAVLQSIYEPNKQVTADDIIAEGVQVAAMAVRFLVNLDRYNYVPNSQMEDGDSDDHE